VYVLEMCLFMCTAVMFVSEYKILLSASLYKLTHFVCSGEIAEMELIYSRYFCCWPITDLEFRLWFMPVSEMFSFVLY